MDVGVSLLASVFTVMRQRLASLLVLLFERLNLFCAIAHGLLQVRFSGEQARRSPSSC